MDKYEENLKIFSLLVPKQSSKNDECLCSSQLFPRVGTCQLQTEMLRVFPQARGTLKEKIEESLSSHSRGSMGAHLSP